jgi:hypothetical protein
MTDIDLMLDCKFGEAGDAKVFHIVQFDSNHFNVVHDGKVATALTWGEMIEQVIALTRPPKLRAYPMQSRDEFVAARKRHEERKENNT